MKKSVHSVPGNPTMKRKSLQYYQSLPDAVGNTAMIKLRKMVATKATVLVKVEFLNPTGSVKDRMAVFILKEAERKGELKPGGTIVEATSGNTGAAVAMYAAAHGYKAVFTIPDKMSAEKIDTLKAFGAEVHICPTAVPPDDPQSYYETAKRIVREKGDAFYLGQYHNLDNIEAHYRSTGPEIWRQTGGQITHLIGGIGTGGTVSGTAKYLKEQNNDIKIIAVDVDGSVYHDYFKYKKLPEPHPYLVEGIGDDMLCPTTDFAFIDDVIKVDDQDSFRAARRLAREEGILAGGSSGSAVAAFLKIQDQFRKNDLAVIILPDHGLKYLSKFYSENWMIEKGFTDE